jgi:PKD repeat protein
MVVSVYDLPQVAFSFDTVCIGDTTHFIDSEWINVAATAQWNYSFGDGNAADVSDPGHRYIAPGTYSVVLQLTDTNGCVGQKQHQVPVYPAPQPAFVFDTACLGLPTHYTDLSTAANFEITQWDWQFGDGATDNLQNPSHIFTQDGVFNTQLTITDAYGCRDSVEQLVNVYRPPVAHFNWSDTSCNAGQVQFADSSYHEQGQSIVSFLWQIDDYETEEQNPLYIFPAVEQSYPVSLVATDERGCTDTTSQEIFVEPELEITFSADTVCFGEETMLIASALKPVAAQVSQWSWYFDDGTSVLTTESDTVYHIFTADGSFRVELTAYQKDTQCTAEATQDVKVRRLPTASFIAEPEACADSTAFLDESISSEGQIDQWTWYFGDGSSATINPPQNPDINHWYPPFLETYQASLIITDEFGCMDSISQQVQRYPCLYVNFETDTNLYCQNTAIIFKDSSIINEDSEILIRYWNFGDGNELTTGPDTDMVSHFYESTGEFTVTYVITFDIGGDAISDTVRKDIRVYPTPVAAIAAENVCDGEEALLVSNTNANGSIISSWTWDFGDGSDSTIISNDVNNAIRHTYEQSGQYPLSLMALTDLGCRDTARMVFTVNPIPQVGFIADTNILCGPGTILFTDTSTIESGSIVRRSWSFGDFTDAIVEEDTVSHFYIPEDVDNTSFYTITLTAVTDSACSVTKSTEEMITQYTLPRPAFTIEPDSVAVSQLENLLVINESENAYYYNWLLADTIFYESTYEPILEEDIQDTGRYQLQLYAQTAEGCWDSTAADFYVYPVLRFFIANAFSPNGNGINEYFGPEGRYFDDKSYRFKIFSRWGELVFETEDIYKKMGW